MERLDDPEEPQAVAVPLDGPLPTWWERTLAGIAGALLMAFVLDIVVHY
jgi:hypothetical protein